MAQKDAIIRNLEHQLEEKEREIDMIRESATNTGVQDDRFMALEKRVVEMEVLVKGLTEELLDLKSIVRKLVKEEKRPVQRPQADPSDHILVRSPKPAAEPEERKPDPKEAEENTVMIMQPDGTLKPEPPLGEGVIIAGKNETLIMKQQQGRKGNAEEIIIGRNVSRKNLGKAEPLIYAGEDETTDTK